MCELYFEVSLNSATRWGSARLQSNVRVRKFAEQGEAEPDNEADHANQSASPADFRVWGKRKQQ